MRLFLIFANFDGSQGWLHSQVLCASVNKAVTVVWHSTLQTQLRGTPARVQDLQARPQDSFTCNNQAPLT